MFDKSLINNNNNIGPNTEPCGKLYFKGKVEDIDELK